MLLSILLTVFLKCFSSPVAAHSKGAMLAMIPLVSPPSDLRAHPREYEHWKSFALGIYESIAGAICYFWTFGFVVNDRDVSIRRVGVFIFVVEYIRVMHGQHLTCHRPLGGMYRHLSLSHLLMLLLDAPA